MQGSNVERRTNGPNNNNPRLKNPGEEAMIVKSFLLPQTFNFNITISGTKTGLLIRAQVGRMRALSHKIFGVKKKIYFLLEKASEVVSENKKLVF